MKRNREKRGLHREKRQRGREREIINKLIRCENKTCDALSLTI